MSMKYEEACWTWSVGFFKSNEMSNGHLSSMLILVYPITHKKILQFSELQDFSLSFIRLWVEMERFELSSKRGTNMLSTCLVLTWFSTVGRIKTTNPRLIS